MFLGDIVKEVRGLIGRDESSVTDGFITTSINKFIETRLRSLAYKIFASTTFSLPVPRGVRRVSLEDNFVDWDSYSSNVIVDDVVSYLDPRMGSRPMEKSVVVMDLTQDFINKAISSGVGFSETGNLNSDSTKTMDIGKTSLSYGSGLSWDGDDFDKSVYSGYEFSASGCVVELESYVTGNYRVSCKNPSDMIAGAKAYLNFSLESISGKKDNCSSFFVSKSLVRGYAEIDGYSSDSYFLKTIGTPFQKPLFPGESPLRPDIGPLIAAGTASSILQEFGENTEAVESLFAKRFTLSKQSSGLYR